MRRVDKLRMNPLDELDDLDDDLDNIPPSTAPIEEQFSQMRTFLEDYTTKLHDMEGALDEFHSRVWSNSDILGLMVEPHEETPLPDLINSDNKPLSKIIMVLSSLCIEIGEYSQIVAKRFYSPIVIFGESAETLVDASRAQGDQEMDLALMLPVFMDLHSFVSRLNALCINLVHQLAATFNSAEKMYKTTFKRIHMRPAFEALSNLLLMLACLDECIAKNTYLCETGLLAYRRMVRNMKAEPAKYGVTEEKLRTLEVRLQNLDEKLLSGGILKACLEQEYDVDVLRVTNNKVFIEELALHLQNAFTTLDDKIDSPTETYQRQQLIGTVCLYLLYRRLTRKHKPNKKLFAAMWTLCKANPLIHIHGPVMMQPLAFVLQHTTEATPLVKVKPGEILALATSYIQAQGQQLPKQVHALYLQVVAWMVRVHSGADAVEKKEVLEKRLIVMVNGLILAHHTSRVMRTCLMGHLELGLPFTKQTLHLIALCAEMLKAIQMTYHQKSAMIGESVVHMCRQLNFTLQNVFVRAQRRLEQRTSATRVPSDEVIDQLAALSIALRMLNGPATRSRRTILELSLNIAQPKTLLKETEHESIAPILWKYTLLSSWQSTLAECCDTTCLFWARDSLPPILEHYYSSAELAQKLPYLLAAYSEGVHACRAARHLPSVEPLCKAFEKIIVDHLHNAVILPLCREIETDLRLNIHAAADSVERRNPFKHRLRDMQAFLKLRPFRLFGQQVDVARHVVHYLDTVFYNLTTLTPQDWKTYGEMRNLAQQKYGLELTEVYLPGATLEQGLDVLEIMRNIHIFVAKYHYNLNNQIFVEKISENKHVNSINIRHVANSIRTHGAGIINTTVNFTYLFLGQKLFIFSQFLFDDHIFSPCLKSHKYFRENKEQLNNMYPYDRADNFNRHIRKLGVTADNLTFLDQFRILITEIGNAMGYVRMVRSGGQHFCSNAIKFVPDLQNIADFADLALKANLAQETIGASKNLSTIIHGLLDNFTEGTDFFKALVGVFRQELMTEKNMHLQYFYIICPPLIINFLDHMVNSKEKLMKRSKEGCFTDDGFAMGLAYLLGIVNQYDMFDSLHWFDSLRSQVSKLKAQSTQQEEIMKAKDRKLTASTNKRKDTKTPDASSVMNLSAKRVEAFALEVDLFYYSFSGARIFFKD
eukprot:c20000_g1_i1.p1 GENE.c20000_g1_i1~~c20000_g1_i1.p1  ORF type:complete len:1160 (+),score=330.55 c20000_g1_i1:1-3480(+)